MLDKLQKWICWTVAASLESLTHHRNVASLSFFYRYYFGRCSSELVQLVPLPYSWGRSTHYSNRLHNFSVTIPRCYKDVYINSFFPYTARLWNSVPIECCPLTYDLSLELSDRLCQPNSTGARDQCSQIFFKILAFNCFCERSVSWKFQLEGST